MMTSSPELGSVAPPARIPPKFCDCHPDQDEDHDPEHQGDLGELRREEDPDGHGDADDGEQDGAAVVPWWRNIDAVARSMWASHPGWPLSSPATRSWSAWGERPEPTKASTASRPQTTTQMALAAVTPTVRAATNGVSRAPLGHSSTASRA